MRTPKSGSVRHVGRDWRCASGFVLALGLGLAPLASVAATISVTSPGDVEAANTCTLRQALLAMHIRSVQLTACANTGVAFGIDDRIVFSTAVFPLGAANRILLRDGFSGALSYSGTPLAIDASANGTVTLERPANAQYAYPILEFANQSPGGTIALSNLIVVNGARGGIVSSSGAELSLVNCAVTGSYGGGIVSNSPVTITGSTISGNEAAPFETGGGIASGSVTLINSTVSGNRAYDGAGVVAYAHLALTNSTISGNVSDRNYGGAFSYAGPMLTNSILAGNQQVFGGTDSNLPPAAGSSGYLFGAASPQLRPLSDNGGLTRTMRPMAGSPALDAVSCASAPPIDQRGIARPQGARCDIGAVEATLQEGTAPPAITQAFGAATIPQEGTTSLTFNIVNPNVSGTAFGVTLSGVTFTDNLPGGLVVATPSGLSNTCGGTATAAAASASVKLTGASIPVGASCMVTVQVKGTTAGVKDNSVQVIASNSGAVGNVSTASVTVVLSPPATASAFSAQRVAPNTPATLTINLRNTNEFITLAGVSLSSNLSAGLVVATPNALTNSCGGTATATAGSSSASLSGVTLVPGASCTVAYGVVGTTTGLKLATSQASSTNAGVGNASYANLDVGKATPVIAHSFGAATIALNGSTSMSYTITNPNPTLPLFNLYFANTLPAGLALAGGVSNTCGGSLSAAAGSRDVQLITGSVAAGGSCTVSMSVTGTTSGIKTNSVQVSNEDGLGNTATATVTVLAPPVISKAFGAARVELNQATSLTFSLSNPNTTVALTGAGFTDALPAGMVVASPNDLSTNCGGTATAVAGAASASLSGATVAAGASCTYVVSVRATTVGAKTNSVQAVSSNAASSAVSQASLLVPATPPAITKQFGAATVELGETTSLTFSVVNPNAAASLDGVRFNDTFPAGLVIATPSGLTTTCGGTATAIAGAASAQLAGASLAAGGSCTLVVNVTGSTLGVKNNSVQASSIDGDGNTSTAVLTVLGAPVIAKAFGAPGILLDESTSLTFSLTNPNTTVSLSGVSFTDSLPAGLVVATPSSLTSTCGGTTAAVAGATTVSLSGASLAAGTSCVVKVNVTGTTVGPKENTVQVTSDGRTGNISTATLTVAPPLMPPQIHKSFDVSGIELGGSTTLKLEITNPNQFSSLSAVGFIDSLPEGLVVSTPLNAASSCRGTATNSAGATSVVVAGATIAPGGSCGIFITVTGATPGVKTNSVAVSAAETGVGNTSQAVLTVRQQRTSQLSLDVRYYGLLDQGNGQFFFYFEFELTNSTASMASDVSLSLSAGLNATSSTLSCQASNGATCSARGTNQMDDKATLPQGSSVRYVLMAPLAQSAGAPVKVIVSATGATPSSISVPPLPPVITSSFGASRIELGGTTSLSLRFDNPNADLPVRSIAVTDTLPPGLVVATPNGLVGTCNTNAKAVAGSSSVSLSEAALEAGAACTIKFDVTGTTPGTKTNSVQVSAIDIGPGNTSVATLAVGALPPAVMQVFGADTIALDEATWLAVTIDNRNVTTPLTGLAFTDNFPPGLIVATPNGVSSTCGGVSSADAGASSASLSGATLAPGVSCTFSMDVKPTTLGVKTNTVQVNSAEGGPSNTSVASLTATSRQPATPQIFRHGFEAPSQ